MVKLQNKKNNSNSKLGEFLNNKRILKGVSLKDVEHATGISASYINRLEKGNRMNPSMEYILRLCRYFEIPISTIIKFFPETSEENNCDNVNNLLINNQIFFANEKASDDVKVSLQRIFKILEENIVAKQPKSILYAQLIEEVDNLIDEVNKSA
ncbi:anaerobic benzoate catabolism transcriptional regulator [Clostridium sp. N3C]|uniref:helix-turn-helix domain-containing protein n=1 Tax=Clostridium sp. N3C TaxID=1776758 RepID=UPI00092E1A9D|nr:helix-turn-helix transcriptional regulator [Clostridium sp. N3C]SCN26039.1 anaerobic benzoate catabolism transcriptional regulator [Clostridium sp. N3C]